MFSGGKDKRRQRPPRHRSSLKSSTMSREGRYRGGQGPWQHRSAASSALVIPRPPPHARHPGPDPGSACLLPLPGLSLLPSDAGIHFPARTLRSPEAGARGIGSPRLNPGCMVPKLLLVIILLSPKLCRMVLQGFLRFCAIFLRLRHFPLVDGLISRKGFHRAAIVLGCGLVSVGDFWRQAYDRSIGAAHLDIFRCHGTRTCRRAFRRAWLSAAYVDPANGGVGFPVSPGIRGRGTAARPGRLNMLTQPLLERFTSIIFRPARIITRVVTSCVFCAHRR